MDGKLAKKTTLSRLSGRIGLLLVWVMVLFSGLWSLALAAGLGDLDVTFGNNGIVVETVPNFLSQTRDVAVQSDGKVVVAGDIYGDHYGLMVARYNPKGIRDANFGQAGFVTTTIAGDPEPAGSGHAVALQADGKIVVAGMLEYFGGPLSNDILVARYKADGSLDSGFGQGGVVTTSIGSSAGGNDIVLQSDGKIVVAGSSDDNFALARYKTDGSLDSGFGQGGVVTTGIGSSASGMGVALQSDGKIVVAGSSDGSFALARYQTGGSLDSSFGNNGIVTSTTTLPASGRDVAVQIDDKIVVVGSVSGEDNSEFAIARYNTNGDPDNTFGGGQIIITPLTTPITTGGSGNAVIIQPGGKIVAVGHSWGDDFGTFTIVRYNTNGSLDSSFGAGGVVTTTGVGLFVYGNGVALQADGKIVVAGSPVGDTPDGIALARYIGDLPPAFLTYHPATGSPLITPTLGVTITQPRPLFDWEDATDDVGVSYYTLILNAGHDAFRLKKETQFTTTQSSYKPNVNLPNDSYTWTVQAHDIVGHVTSVITPANFTIESGQVIYLPEIFKHY